MNRTPFSDPAAAIDEAVFMSGQTNQPHALVALDAETINVIPLIEAIGLEILEVCKP